MKLTKKNAHLKQRKYSNPQRKKAWQRTITPMTYFLDNGLGRVLGRHLCAFVVFAASGEISKAAQLDSGWSQRDLCSENPLKWFRTPEVGPWFWRESQVWKAFPGVSVFVLVRCSYVGCLHFQDVGLWWDQKFLKGKSGTQTTTGQAQSFKPLRLKLKDLPGVLSSTGLFSHGFLLNQDGQKSSARVDDTCIYL